MMLESLFWFVWCGPLMSGKDPVMEGGMRTCSLEVQVCVTRYLLANKPNKKMNKRVYVSLSNDPVSSRRATSSHVLTAL